MNHARRRSAVARPPAPVLRPPPGGVSARKQNHGGVERSAAHALGEIATPAGRQPQHHREKCRVCFGTGTAATVSPVRRIRYRHHDIDLPPPPEDSVGSVLRNRLVAIATGHVPDAHGWLDVL